MPCDSSYLEPTQIEQESVRVRGFLRKLKLPVDGPDVGPSGIDEAGDMESGYGRASSIDIDTATLCAWCRSRKNRPKLKRQSLELQIWWRDHQRADAQRRRRQRAEKAKQALRQQAISKLSPAEQKALGIRRSR